jgi:cell cycle checkpoint protein MEC1
MQGFYNNSLQASGGEHAESALSLSIQGQVHRLIKEATSAENLSRMYVGWMPFL